VRTCLIFNPTAKGDKARRLQRHFDVIQSDCSLKQTYAQGAAHTLAAEAVNEGYEVIVAAGGDGTLNEVLNGIAEVPGGLDNVKLGVIPLGTVNVFAREVGIPIDLKKAWDNVLAGHSRRYALPMMEFQQDGETKQRYFVQLAGVGLDARAVELVNWRLKKAVGPLAYVVAGMRALQEKPSRMKIEHDGQVTEGELVLIGNGRYYGGSFPILPNAVLEEQLIEACVIPDLKFRSLFRAGIAALTQFRKTIKGATYFKTNAFTLTAIPPAPIQVEGEAIGRTPARLSFSGETIEVIVPESTANLPQPKSGSDAASCDAKSSRITSSMGAS